MPCRAVPYESNFTPSWAQIDKTKRVIHLRRRTKHSLGALPKASTPSPHPTTAPLPGLRPGPAYPLRVGVAGRGGWTGEGKKGGSEVSFPGTPRHYTVLPGAGL